MLALIIILSVLLLLALLRVGIIVQYNEAGTALWLKTGFLRFKLKTGRPRKPKRESKFKLGDLKPGSFSEFMGMLRSLKKALGRLRRKLLIKKLVLYCTFAGDDPAKTALEFGAAHAVFGSIVPIFDKLFRIKRRDLRAAADFSSDEPKIYMLLSISIAVWEIFYAFSALLSVFAAAAVKPGAVQGKANKSANMGKGGNEDGERTDKQPA